MRKIVVLLGAAMSFLFAGNLQAQQVGIPQNHPLSIWGVVFITFFCLGLLAIYFVPCFVSGYRGCTKKWAVWVVNVFFGWTLLGWVVALVMAISYEKQADYDVRMAAMKKIASGA